MRYFSQFPTISYANTIAKNILARVRIDKKFEDQVKNFYPYQLEPGDRPDVVAYGYYDDAYSDWMVYYANKIVDPYFEYYLDQNDFDTFIINKYSSIANAQSQIYAYRNNWTADESVITEASYAVLSPNLKKYWAPVIGYSGSVTGYERAKRDTSFSTNRIEQLTITLSGNTNFTVGEKASLKNGAVYVANGDVTFANTTTVIVQHVEGGFVANSSYTLTGNRSSANAVVTAQNLIQQNIPDTEVLYYSTVSLYDYENELNESKRSIQLIDNRYSSTIERQFINLMGT